MAQMAFNAAEVDPTPTFEVLPAGEYPVIISDSEMKPTKNGNGEYLQITLEVIDGPYRGRLLFDRLNLVNPNQTAVEIAQRTLSQICHAVGVLNVTDSLELHNKPMVAKVSVRPPRGEYGESNEVKQYKAAGTAVAPSVAPAYQQPAANTAPPVAQAAPQPAAASVPPWQR